MKRSLVLFLVLCLGFALFAVGCGGGGSTSTEPTEEEEHASGEKFVIGLSVMNTVEPFYKDLSDGAEAAAQDYGAELIVTSAEADLAKQISQTEDFIASGVDGIVLCPADSAGIVPAVEKANEANIPVVTSDIDAHGGEVLSFVASNNKKGGELAAEFIAEAIGGKGEVVMLDHPQITSVYQRGEGFVKTIDKYPEIEIVQRPEVTFSRDSSMKTTEDMLQTYPNLKAIFAPVGADAGIGANAAAMAAGRSDLVIVNFDAVDESLALIEKGDQALKADIKQNSYEIGYKSVEALIKHLLGEEVPRVIEIDVELVK